MAMTCYGCGIDLAPGAIGFSDRVRLSDGRLACGECRWAQRNAPRMRQLSDLEAATWISAERRVEMGASAMLYMARTGF